MRFLSKIITIIVSLSIIGISGQRIHLKLNETVCNTTLSYKIGEVDERFNISRERFASLVAVTESVWENEVDFNLFQYDPESDFVIDLVFDERQERTFKGQEINKDLSEMKRDLDAVANEHKNLVSQYNTLVSQYESKLSIYNKSVAQLNSQSTISEESRASINNESTSINTLASQINSLTTKVNTSSNEVSAITQKYNNRVTTFNDLYEGDDNEFERGLYTGDSISIFEFRTEKDLQQVIAHEFGHALDIGHVEEVNSIMHYITSADVVADLKLSNDDKNALGAACKKTQFNKIWPQFRPEISDTDLLESTVESA